MEDGRQSNSRTGTGGALPLLPQRVRRLLTWKTFSRLLLAGYLLLLIPLLWIAMYDFPSSDDFSMALQAHLAFESTGSAAAAAAAAVRKTISLYLTWTGYYTSSLFTTISPATFGIQWYGLSAVLVFTVLQVSVAVFLYVVLERALGMNRYVRRCVTLAALFLMIQMMPEGEARVEAFYWYSGAGNYTLTFSVLLLYLSCLMLAAGAGSRGRRRLFLVLAAAAGFLAGGANYMSALTGAILTVLALLLLILNWSGVMAGWIAKRDMSSYTVPDNEGTALAVHRTDLPGGHSGSRAAPQERRKRTDEISCAESFHISHIFLRGVWGRQLLIPMLIMLVGFVLNCAAPGNSIRGASTGGFSAVKAIAVSLWATLRYPLDEWMRWPLILVLVLLGISFRYGDPGMYDRGRLTFRHPVVMTALAYGLVSANATPCYYALGNMDAGRLQALFWMQFVLAAVLLEWYLIGWYCTRAQGGVAENCDFEPGEHNIYRAREGREQYDVRNRCSERAFGQPDGEKDRAIAVRTAAFLMFLLLGGSVLCCAVNPDYYTFSSALEDLMNGNADAYAQENAQRLAILEDDSIEDAVLQRYTTTPDLLYYADIDPDPEDWANVKIAEYFGKDSVRGE